VPGPPLFVRRRGDDWYFCDDYVKEALTAVPIGAVATETHTHTAPTAPTAKAASALPLGL